MAKKPIAKIVLFGGILITVLAPLAGTALMIVSSISDVIKPISEIAEIEPELVTIIFVTAGGLLFGLMTIGILMIIGGAFAPMLSSFSKNKTIRANGVAADAKIMNIEDTGARINDAPVVLFTLEVQPATAAKFVAQTKQTVSLIHMPSYQPGKLVEVKYIPGTEDVAIVGPKAV